MTVTNSNVRAFHLPSTGAVFAGRNGLDFLELRLGVVRIPEVSLRIREAQTILDSLDVERVDLMGMIVAEDESFFRNIKMKSLLAAIVQVGLYDRLLKSQRAPEVLVGNANGDSALLVCAGQVSFEQMVKSSSAFQTLSPREDSESASESISGSAPAPAALGLLPGIQAPLQAMVPAPEAVTPVLQVLPSLSGLNLTEYRAFVRSEGGLSEIGQPMMDLKKLIAEVVENQGAARFMNIGPAQALAPQEYEQIAELAGADEVTIIDSIDLDPMLSWFWKEMRPVVSGFAQ